jgi:hypothetical protein
MRRASRNGVQAARGGCGDDGSSAFLCSGRAASARRSVGDGDAAAALSGAASQAAASTELVSVRSNGKQGDDISGRFSAPAISANGLVAAFDSQATNLVGGDNNGVVDVFVHDRTTGRTTAVSVSSRGRLGNGVSTSPALSADGRFVAFESNASNLVAADTNSARDIFVRHRGSGVTERISVDSAGNQSDDHSNGFGIRGGSSFGPEISANGGHVAFDSQATNLIADDTNTCSLQGGQSFPTPGQCADIFVHVETSG